MRKQVAPSYASFPRKKTCEHSRIEQPLAWCVDVKSARRRHPSGERMEMPWMKFSAGTHHTIVPMRCTKQYIIHIVVGICNSWILILIRNTPTRETYFFSMVSKRLIEWLHHAHCVPVIYLRQLLQKYEPSQVELCHCRLVAARIVILRASPQALASSAGVNPNHHHQ